ncbi:MAG: sporulation initiation factor Spo0A C-terminal domain-containing protein [Oscillospiraceae bacterium]|nr:sporulation initiation factor Spo0A C-terminal domain-containing protein [Oscillospiraceae bacterium]
MEKIKVVIINSNKSNINKVNEYLKLLKEENVEIITVKKHHYEIVKNLEDEHFQENLKSRIINILDLIGMPKNRVGYQYILSAIFYLNRTGKTRHLKLSTIYAELMLIYQGKSMRSIDRTMETAIEATFNHGNKNEIDKIFHNIVSKENGKISNKKFIYTLAERIS